MEEHNCCRCSQRKKERSPEEYKRLIHRLNRIEGPDPRASGAWWRPVPTVPTSWSSRRR